MGVGVGWRIVTHQLTHTDAASPDRQHGTSNAMPEPAIFGFVDMVGGLLTPTSSFVSTSRQTYPPAFNTAPPASRTPVEVSPSNAESRPSVRALGLRPEAVELANRMDTNNV